MLQMLGPCAVVDQNVIKTQEQSGGRHEAHRSSAPGRRRGVDESERHDQEFEVAMVRQECHLGDVLWVHQHLVVTAVEVELGEVARPLG
jgi:hypothetical protein